MKSRIIYGPYLSQTAKQFALDQVRQSLERVPTPLESDELFHQSGSYGPARSGWPSYERVGSGFPYRNMAGELVFVPRGKVWICVGEGAFRDGHLFRVRDLIAEVRSGASQMSLFGNAA